MSSSSSSSPPGEDGKLYMLEEGMRGGMLGGIPGGIVKGKPACITGDRYMLGTGGTVECWI